MRKIVTFLLCSFFAKNLSAQKYVNEFLNIGAGARGMAMGNSLGASVDDASAQWYNPAGLVNMKIPTLTFMHSEYFAGIMNYDYGGLAFRIKRHGGMGLSFIHLGADHIPDTYQLIDDNGQIHYDRVTEFSAADWAFMMSLANKKLFRRYKRGELNYGSTAKIIHRVVGDYATAWGFGFDAGFQYEFKKAVYGLTIKDVSTTYTGWSFFYDDEHQAILNKTGNDIPIKSYEIMYPKLTFSAATDFKISKTVSLRPEGDLDITFDGRRNVLLGADFGSFEPHGGLELTYNKKIFFRGGLSKFQTYSSNKNQSKKVFAMEPSLGVGVKFKKLTLDYAFIDFGSNDNAGLRSHVLGLRFLIEKK